MAMRMTMELVDRSWPTPTDDDFLAIDVSIVDRSSTDDDPSTDRSISRITHDWLIDWLLIDHWKDNSEINRFAKLLIIERVTRRFQGKPWRHNSILTLRRQTLVWDLQVTPCDSHVTVHDTIDSVTSINSMRTLFFLQNTRVLVSRTHLFGHKNCVFFCSFCGFNWPSTPKGTFFVGEWNQVQAKCSKLVICAFSQNFANYCTEEERKKFTVLCNNNLINIQILMAN